MLKATALIAGSLLLGMSTAAVAAAPQQLAQAQMQNRSQIDQDYQARLRAAKTPEERARIQQEYDLRMQQGALPNNSDSVRTAPGTGSSSVPPNRRPTETMPGQTPGSGMSVPPGRSE
jgi:hypothetical protein